MKREVKTLENVEQIQEKQDTKIAVYCTKCTHYCEILRVLMGNTKYIIVHVKP